MQTTRNPEWMTLSERMSEAAAILATGILRHKMREINETRKSRRISANGLDVFQDKSVHSNKPIPKGESR